MSCDSSPQVGTPVKEASALLFSTPVQRENEGPNISVCEGALVESTTIVLKTPSSESTVRSTISSLNTAEVTTPSLSSRSTPLTSPKSSPVFRKYTQDSDLSPLLRKIGGPEIVDEVTTGLTECVLGINDDDFKPVKLFRNFTAQAQQISETHKQKCLDTFSTTPEIDFSNESYVKATISRRRTIITTTEVTETISDDEGPPHEGSRQTYKGRKSATAMRSSTIVAKPSNQSSAEFRTLLGHILPYELDQRLSHGDYTCVASMVKGGGTTRCSARAKPPKDEDSSAGNRAKGIDRIANIEDCVAMDRFLDQIKHVIRFRMCGTHQKAALSKRMVRLRTFVQNPQKSSIDTSACYAWIDAICSDDGEPKRGDIPKSPHQSINISMHPGAPIATRKSASVLNFKPYQVKWAKRLSVSEALLRVIKENLKPTDLKRGYIYIFWHKGQFGKVKIGRSYDQARRLEKWNKQCDRIHDFHISSYKGELEEVPHVSRIERLIHLELKAKRQRSLCDGCFKWHTEWFEVDEKEAVEIFKKWRDWIAQKPYEEDPKTGVWKLKEKAEETLDQVCRETETVAVPKDTARLTKPSTVSSKHGYNLRPRTASGKVRSKNSLRT